MCGVCVACVCVWCVTCVCCLHEYAVSRVTCPPPAVPSSPPQKAPPLNLPPNNNLAPDNPQTAHVLYRARARASCARECNNCCCGICCCCCRRRCCCYHPPAASHISCCYIYCPYIFSSAPEQPSSTPLAHSLRLWGVGVGGGLGVWAGGNAAAAVE